MKLNELEKETKDDILELKKKVAKKELLDSLESIEDAKRSLERAQKSHSKLLEMDVEDFSIPERSTNKWTSCGSITTC